MLTSLKNFLRDDEGATMVEYGLMVALIAVVCIVAVGTLGGNINDMFGDVATEVESVGAE